MRNAFVVLVSLCIGIASGFIVPSSDTEVYLASDAANDVNEDIKLEDNLTKLELGQSSVLPDNRTNIDETALYEHAADKQNNQSERAFIYINQKYKRPSLHQYFRLSQNGAELAKRHPLTPPLPHEIMLQRNNDPCKSESAQVNSYFREFQLSNDNSQDIASYFVKSRHPHKCIINSVQNRFTYKGNNYDLRLNHYDKIASEQRDYIELLKSPMLRRLNEADSPKYDGSPGSTLSPISSKDFLTLHHPSKQHNPKANILVDERKAQGQEYFGFSPLYAGHQSKGLLQGGEHSNFGGDYTNDDDASRILDKSQDEDKLLAQYLKDALEDQVTSKEPPVNQNACTYRDCILQHTKPSSSVGHHKITLKHDCKCGPQIKFKLKDTQASREKLGEEEINSNNTNINKPSDVTYYEDILSEDSDNKKSQDLDMTFISKLNSTLYN